MDVSIILGIIVIHISYREFETPVETNQQSEATHTVHWKCSVHSSNALL